MVRELPLFEGSFSDAMIVNRFCFNGDILYIGDTLDRSDGAAAASVNKRKLKIFFTAIFRSEDFFAFTLHLKKNCIRKNDLL